MPAAKVAVTIDSDLLRKVDRWVKAGEYPSRSRAVQEALYRLEAERDRDQSYLSELEKLDPEEEVALAEEWLAPEAPWSKP
jgi:Arc/MetJ-type ribon-helix-helix transcriptional regulator